VLLQKGSTLAQRFAPDVAAGKHQYIKNVINEIGSADPKF
jgi:hypothetical protein